MVVGILFAAGCGNDSTSTSNAIVGTPSAVGSTGAPTVSPVGDPGEDNTKLDDTALKARIQAAGTGISTVRAVGDIRSSHPNTRIGFDLRYDHRRKNYVGSMTYGEHRLDLRRVGPDLYLKATGNYWTASGRLADPNAAALLHDKYVRIKVNNSRFEDVTETAEYGNVATVVSDWKSDTQRRSEESLGGTRTIVVAVPNGDDGNESRLYVPATGNPVPVRLTDPEYGTIDWSDLGKPVDVTAPPAADTVDLPPLAAETRPRTH
ncbi:hypothetical protein [Embleya sp. NPDC050493]|uniref:hypothetical protein n=1 Tax=Embleya sp. NPDC050493 TaxID=3363989 RepID=UPI0037A48444